MALNSLFALDPTKYGLRTGAGSFRRVGEAKRQLTAAELLEGLSAPEAPTNVPTVTPLSDAAKNAVEGFSGYRSSTAQNIRNIFGAGEVPSITNSLLDPGYAERLRTSARIDKTYRDRYNQAADIASNFYSYYQNQIKAPTDTYNAQVRAYNAVLDPYKQELADYKTAREERVKNYNASSIDPAYVDKQTSRTQGDILADTQLYSENLHNLMIDRISTQPVIDEVSSLFSRSSGGTK